MGLNGGPEYIFSPANSYVIPCETQEEIDFYWEKLGEGGVYSKCGWLDDKYGVSWQIVPTILEKLMMDAEKAPRVMQAFMKMTKFDIEALIHA
jgi:predicted 3-demethylubiquinone-9 3-methyltransferase (glyoxalase superfamily)